MTEPAIAPKGHPKGLYILFATEMWERFNFYGMRAMLVLFMTKALLFDQAFASNLYGSYLSLIYLTPLLGGFMADRYWGNRRSIIAGGIVMAVGELILFACGTLYKTAPDVSTFLYFSGLGLMIAGNGFFKPNISSLVGQLYPKNDHRKDAAYTIFYMGINTGGMLGPFICGLFGDTGNPGDFRWAFLIAGIGMVISVVVQKLFYKYVTDPDKKVLGSIPANSPKIMLSPLPTILGLAILASTCIGLLYLDTRINYLFYLLVACIVIIPAVIFMDKTLNAIEKNKVVVIFVVCFFVIFFWAAFEQAGASLTIFADAQTDRHLGLSIPVWIVYVLSAALLYFISRLYKKASANLAAAFDKQLRVTVYGLLSLFAAGIIVADIYLITGGYTHVTRQEVPASWFQSLNSAFVVLFAPFFAWLWLTLGKREPSSPTKMALGLFLLALGYLWIAKGVNNVAPGVKVSMIWLTGMYALHTGGELCLSPIGMSLVNKLSPLKFSSLLMAIWFTANAFGNKVAGVLSSLYPNEGHVTSFLGYKMHNRHEFFMLFVVMAGTASLVLFLLTKKLQKMMHSDV
jgi:POT family proton-dependent oligopeptide transporter